MRIIFALLLISCQVHGQFIDRKAEGWHFYEEAFKEPGLDKEKEEELKTAPVLGPLQKLKKFKEKVERLKAIAVMEPTFENVQAYMVIQKELMSKSSLFAKKWLEVVYTTPELDYSLKHPTSQTARHVYLDNKKMEMDTQIQRLSRTHGLFFFFSNSCAYCKHFATIVKAFSERYGWKVMAISTDGSVLPEFPDAVVDNGTARKLGVQFVPTLLAVNPVTEEVTPLSHGMSSQDQILDRIRVLIIERNHP